MDDLISREAVKEKFPLMECEFGLIMNERLHKGIDELPSAFEGMTNGEVMKAVFPNCYMGIDDDEWIVTNIDGRTMFQPEWWDAPYKAEREE